MIVETLIAELKAVSDTLAETNADLAAINRYVAQTGEIRSTPALTFNVEAEKLYRNRAGIVKVILTLESTPGDVAAEAAHLARVVLVSGLFLDGKAVILAALGARGKVTVDDWGQIAAPRPDVNSEAGGADRLRSILYLRAAARLV